MLRAAVIGALLLAGCASEYVGDDCSDPRCFRELPLYGGEIVLDALIRPDLSEVTSVSAFVVDSVDYVDNRFGAYTSLPTPPPDDGSIACTRYFPDNQDRWPLQDLNLEANEVTHDAGGTMTFSDGEGTEYTLSRKADSMDTEGRTHDFVYSYAGEGLPPAGKRWTATFENPVDAYAEILKGFTYSPTNIDWVSPPYSAGGIIIDRSRAMTITWSQADPEASAPGTEHFNLLAIYSIPAGPPEDFHWLCLTQKDGEMTIPQDVISTFPDQGLFIIGNIAHFQPRGTNGRVLHQIGRYRRVQPFTGQN